MSVPPQPAHRPDITVQEHIACVECGYDLYLQPADGPCPECKTPIGESIAHSRYLYGDAKGTAAVTVLLAILCALGTVGMVLGYALGSAYFTQLSFSVAGFTFITAWAWSMNYRATASPQAQQRGVGRWASRVGVLMNGIGILIGAMLGIALILVCAGILTDHLFRPGWGLED